MDQSKAKAVVEREVEGYKRAFGIPHWNTRFVYGPIEGHDSAHGQVTYNVDYNAATVELDPFPMEDEAHLLKVLRHELFHILLTPWQLAERMLDDLTDGDPKLKTLVSRVVTHAKEQSVINLERMYQGLRETPPPDDQTPLSGP